MSGSVLVVDDDADLRASLCGVFEGEGYRAVGVSNGRDALEYLANDPLPCVVVLDLMMPVMNGWEFLGSRQNDARLAKVPVVVLSALADQNVLGMLGIDRLLKKPVPIGQLLESVSRHCGPAN